MAELTEKFANHPLHETVQALDSALTEIETSDLSDISAIELIDRVRQVQRFATTRFGGVDPSLVPRDRFDSINSLFKEQVAQLSEYKTDQNVARLTNASNTCDQILNQLASIPITTTPADVEGLREAMISFRRSLGQHARHIETDYDNLKKEFEGISARFAELTTEITSQKGRLDTAISTFQEQFSAAESTRREEYATESKTTRDELNGIMESTKQELTSTTSDFKQQFREAETERKTQYTTESKSTRDELNRIVEIGKQEFSDISREHKLTFTTLATEAKESRITMEQEFSEKVDEYLAQLDVSKAKAEKLVHVIGNTGMVGGYQQVANQERRSSRYWNAATGLFVLGFIGFAIFAFETLAQGEFKLGTFGARAFVAIAIGIGLAWAARQAERHQETERRNRRMELELASIDPFLALLPEPTRFEVKRELANRFFGQPEPTASGKRDKTTGSLLDIVTMLIKTVGELAAKK